MKYQYILTPYFLDQSLPDLMILQQSGWDLVQEYLPETQTITRMAVLHASLARKVHQALEEGKQPVSIAGDCCTALGMWAGLNRGGIQPTLIWFDAHGDFNTWDTTPSGFLGGMPLAMLAGLGELTILEILEVDPLNQDQIILTDARDLDPGEKELVKGSNITHLQDPEDLLTYDFGEGPLWIHFDTDILNPEFVPAQNYPAPGGPDPDQLSQIFQHLAGTGSIKAVSLSSWAPNLPQAEGSGRICMDLLEILLGSQV